MPENMDKLVLEEKELFWTKLLLCPHTFGNNDFIKTYESITNITNPLTHKNNHPCFSLLKKLKTDNALDINLRNSQQN